MKITFEPTGQVEKLATILKVMEQDEAVRGIMILACDANGFTSERVDPLLQAMNKPVWGGVFPQVLYEKKNVDQGTLVVGISHQVETLIIPQIGDENQDLEAVLAAFEKKPLEDRTLFVFLDGLSAGVAALKESLFNCLGLKPNYIGGGAGSLSFIQKPCILTGKGMLQDAAVLALADMKSGVGVAHGWKPVSEPLKITQADRNRILSINWKPAFQVYRELVEALSGSDFNQESFFKIAKNYPFGIIKMAAEMVVRDPIEVTDDQAILCVGEVPVNSFVYLLQGDKEGLLRGAAEARLLAEKSADETIRQPHVFLIDCISRVLFLENDFEEELATIHQGGPLFGALTLGEIANSGKAYLEFYNKTTVVALLEG